MTYLLPQCFEVPQVKFAALRQLKKVIIEKKHHSKIAALRTLKT